MSETIASPAPAPDATGPVSPPAASQPAISISDAARLLRQQRGQEPAAPKAPEAPATPEAKPEPSDGRSAMERSLGIPEGGAEPAEAALELDGTRYSHTQLREAVSKARDYTQKTQQLAEQQRALQAQQESLATILPYIQPELARLQEALAAPPPKPDDSLIATDPQLYLQQKAAYERVLEEQQRLAGLNQLQAQARAQMVEQQLAAANKQLEAEFPWWADPVERDKARAELIAWATEKGGYTRQELGHLVDARHLKMMMKAAYYDKWVSGTRTQAPRAQQAAQVRGTPPPPAPTERVAQAEQSFDSRPNIRNATALLTARRSNGSTLPRG